jgi:hypothetical protein
MRMLPSFRPRILVLALPALLLSCAGSGTNEPEETALPTTGDSETEDTSPEQSTRRGLVFPVLEERIGEEAGLDGRLVRRGRCLVVESSGRTALPIWPPGFTYEKDGKAINILDENGKVVAEVGSPISMAGGAGRFLPEHLRGHIKPCSGGTYWAISIVVNE